MRNDSPDVVVIGGGAIGCATAWELARRGALVTVIERATPGQEATWAAGGMLSPIGISTADDAFLSLATASLDRYPAFVEAIEAATGIELGYCDNGKLYVAFDVSEDAVLASLIRRGREFLAESLTGDDARRREPALSGAVRGAVFIGRDHRLNNRQLGAALWSGAARAGVDFLLGAAALEVLTAVHRGRCRVEGILLATGTRVPASRLVIAAGAWSNAIAGLPTPVPVRPIRGQMFAVRGDASSDRNAAEGPLLEHTIMTRECYIIPRVTGELVVGATVEDAGFTPGPTPRGIATLIAAAVQAVPCIRDLPLIESWSGFRPGTPDDLPILGPDPDVDGLFYATGHYRNGILLTPVTAEVIADVVLGQTPAIAIDRFNINRFRD